MGLNISYISGQTSLDDEEKEGLRIAAIATRQELDEFEQQNIEDAMQWFFSKKPKPEALFSERFIRNLHKRMYGKVWKWAGEFRTTEKNIGVASWKIPSELKVLLDDALFWTEKETYPPDELAIRFKHRLVSIHCFPNGNGRHSRLIADIIVAKIFGLPEFSWGSSILSKENTARHQYIQAVRKAGKGDLQPLIEFARS